MTLWSSSAGSRLYKAELAAARQACRDSVTLRSVVALRQQRRPQPARQAVELWLLRLRILGRMRLQQLPEARCRQLGRVAKRLRPCDCG